MEIKDISKKLERTQLWIIGIFIIIIVWLIINTIFNINSQCVLSVYGNRIYLERKLRSKQSPLIEDFKNISDDKVNLD